MNFGEVVLRCTEIRSVCVWGCVGSSGAGVRMWCA